jgi:hydrogenase maturation protein HypF
MCLGIPGRVVALVDGYADQVALVDVEGAERRINIGMLDAPPRAGEWVLIHMGFALEVVSEEDAARALAGLEMLGSGSAGRVRRRLEVAGVVQGVGFRPFVYAAASELGLSGEVRNDSSGVVLEVEGDDAAVEELTSRIRHHAPPLAVVEALTVTELAPVGGTGFRIADTTLSGGGRTLASPDVAMCADCAAELHDPTDRRHGHAFISCTNCGPRYTIITGLPYDRPATTMAPFEMCPVCRSEYDDPADRRFHAQTIACRDCGPTLRLHLPGQPDRVADESLGATRALLAQGAIVAIKGLGGYHLACDATNEMAVAELRRRKQRGGKPFAVMARDLQVAHAVAAISTDEEAVLSGARRPILLMPRRAGTGVAPSVAPGNPDLGVLLPYTPVHELLLAEDLADPGGPGAPALLVMTSGNLSGEPLVSDDAEALVRLAGLADAWLSHDREIRVPCDDSVARWVARAELPVRRARGYAPLPIALPFAVAPALAAGADLKNACCVADGGYAWLSQHLGDMDDVATLDALSATADHLELLTGVSSAGLVADAHPGYRSSAWARRRAHGRPVATVQHHHAHVASVMGEHGVAPDRSVIGVALDGTGYGPDGAVWGGEVLLADYKGFQRFAHLAYVPLAGGDASVERPYRMALAHLHAAGVDWAPDLAPVVACPADEQRVLARQLETGFGCVPTSSTGRLFDAVSALAGVRQVVDYEAEAAIELEGLARGVEVDQPYRFDLGAAAGSVVADPAPVVRAVVADLRAGVGVPMVAARFHAGMVGLVVELCRLARDRAGLETVALGGGVFQNAVLLTGVVAGLEGEGFEVLRPRLLPPNDGGIALGQILIAAAVSG